MEIEFPFIRQKAEVVDFISRPFAKVVLNDGIAEWFYIDSGADITTIPLHLGQLLGFRKLDGENIRELKGIGGGKIPYLIRKVKIQIGEKRFEARIAWCLIQEISMVLGRLDVFDKFDIVIKERENKVIFTDKNIGI